MEDWRQDIGKALTARLEGKVRMGELIAPHTTYRIGGPADVFIEVESLSDLAMVSEFLDRHRDVSYEILGGGSNVLFPVHYQGVVLHPGKNLSRIEHDGPHVTAGAGADLMKVLKQAAEWGLGGMAFLAGIPGSVGGAIKGNAGAFGRCISECVHMIRGFDIKERREKELLKDQIEWSYRKTNIPASLFISAVILALKPCPVITCMDEISRILAERTAKLPKEPSAGCVFVNPNPPDVTAGKLIDELGFKGHKVGDALCSPQHANFIVNMGNATQSDVLALIREIKQAVKERYGYELREEIRIVSSGKKGNSDEEIMNQMEDNNG